MTIQIAENLAHDLEDVAIRLARRPEGLRGGAKIGTLPPRLWERLRLQLQAEYRRATGEPQAVLVVESLAGHDASNGSGKPWLT